MTLFPFFYYKIIVPFPRAFPHCLGADNLYKDFLADVHKNEADDDAEMNATSAAFEGRLSQVDEEEKTDEDAEIKDLEKQGAQWDEEQNRLKAELAALHGKDLSEKEKTEKFVGVVNMIKDMIKRTQQQGDRYALVDANVKRSTKAATASFDKADEMSKVLGTKLVAQVRKSLVEQLSGERADAERAHALVKYEGGGREP